jgi:hypothetical protein
VRAQKFDVVAMFGSNILGARWTMSPDEIRFRVSSLKSRLLDRDEELGVAFLKKILFSFVHIFDLI